MQRWGTRLASFSRMILLQRHLRGKKFFHRWLKNQPWGYSLPLLLKRSYICDKETSLQLTSNDRWSLHQITYNLWRSISECSTFINILKAIYGHPIAGQLWNDKFVSFMISAGFLQLLQRSMFFLQSLNKFLLSLKLICWWPTHSSWNRERT